MKDVDIEWYKRGGLFYMENLGYTVEKAWESSGYHCEVRIMPLGHRCGYVGVKWVLAR